MNTIINVLSVIAVLIAVGMLILIFHNRQAPSHSTRVAQIVAGCVLCVLAFLLAFLHFTNLSGY